MRDQVLNFLQQKVPHSKAEWFAATAGDSYVVVDTASIYDVCKALRDSSEWDINVLQVITGTDFSSYIEVSYILASFTKNLELIVKVRPARNDAAGLPRIPTVTALWLGANWQERECADMVGVEFIGHPDPRRILCPDDWEGYPLRRDYKVAKTYLGMEINPEHKMNWDDRLFLEQQEAAMKALGGGSSDSEGDAETEA